MRVSPNVMARESQSALIRSASEENCSSWFWKMSSVTMNAATFGGSVVVDDVGVVGNGGSSPPDASPVGLDAGSIPFTNV